MIGSRSVPALPWLVPRSFINRFRSSFRTESEPTRRIERCAAPEAPRSVGTPKPEAISAPFPTLFA